MSAKPKPAGKSPKKPAPATPDLAALAKQCEEAAARGEKPVPNFWTESEWVDEWVAPNELIRVNHYETGRFYVRFRVMDPPMNKDFPATSKESAMLLAQEILRHATLPLHQPKPEPAWRAAAVECARHMLGWVVTEPSGDPNVRAYFLNLLRTHGLIAKIGEPGSKQFELTPAGRALLQAAGTSDAKGSPDA